MGKAFETLGEIKGEQLKKAEGWHYLLIFLEDTRGRAKVDILGDTFTKFLLRKEACCRDGEEINDYETRFKTLVRRMERAIAETNSNAKMPPEVCGWFLLSVFMRMSPSDTANIRGKASSYKVEDVLTALGLMWSSGGPGSRDAELLPRKTTTGQAYHQDEVVEKPEADMEGDDAEEIFELEEWCEDATAELLADTEDSAEILANFKEARRALDQARTARGFYPVKPPGQGQFKGKASQSMRSYSRSKAPTSDADRICFRCGKKGHATKRCPQKPTSSGSNSIGYVGWCDDERPLCTEAHSEVHLMTNVPISETVSGPSWVLCSQETATGQVLALQPADLRGKAIVDSGASDNVVGAETLQELAECLEELEFHPNNEIVVDRQIHKRFVFGNGESSAGLGLSHVNAGICGKEVTIQSHLVEGKTPLLLYSKLLYDMDATINFLTGKAVFLKLSDRQVQLERTESNHLMLPLTAFAGHREALQELFVKDDGIDQAVHTLSLEPERRRLAAQDGQCRSRRGSGRIGTAPPRLQWTS